MTVWYRLSHTRWFRITEFIHVSDIGTRHIHLAIRFLAGRQTNKTLRSVLTGTGNGVGAGASSVHLKSGGTKLNYVTGPRQQEILLFMLIMIRPQCNLVGNPVIHWKIRMATVLLKWEQRSESDINLSKQTS